MIVPIVYLDTQDYINTFNHPDGDTAKVISVIESQQRSDKIRIGYSGFIVWEFVTNSDENFRQDRIDRGRLLKRICNGNAFPYLSDIPRGARFPNDGIWMPRDVIERFSAKNIETTFSAEIKRALKEKTGLNRKERRALGDGKAFLRALVKENPEFGSRREDFGDIPVTDRILEKRLFRSYIMGNVSSNTLSNEMIKGSRI